jgi:hypothetical protein
MKYNKIETQLVGGELPGNRSNYRNTQFYAHLNAYVGEYKEGAPVQAEHSEYLGNWPPAPQEYQTSFAQHEFLALFDENEHGRVEDATYRKGGNPLGKKSILRYWNILTGAPVIDLELPLVVEAVGALLTEGIFQDSVDPVARHDALMQGVPKNA